MYKLKGRTLLNEDLTYPDIPYAEFSKEICKDQVKTIVNDLNYGKEFLLMYQAYRDNLHIANVYEMLNKMDKLFQAWDLINYTNKKFRDTD